MNCLTHYGSRFIRSSRSWKRGSSRRRSNVGSVLSVATPSCCSKARCRFSKRNTHVRLQGRDCIDLQKTISGSLQSQRCTVPPNADCYWVGDAGPGPSYIERGQGNLYTNRTARFLASGVVRMAKMLKEHGPIQSNLLKLTEEAQKVSTDTAPAG